MHDWLSRTSEGDFASHLQQLLEMGYLRGEHTAVIVHDLESMGQRLDELKSAFPANTLHAVAVKANPLLEVLKTLVRGGAGLEIASRGELALDIGGGLPTRYGEGDSRLHHREYAKALERHVPELWDYSLITEIGRGLQAGCGWAASRVEYADESKAILHLGADFALREAYQTSAWFHEFTVFDREGRLKKGPGRPVDLYGPLCFSGDRLAAGRELPAIEEGDIVVMHDVGGYTLGMWSRYCSREMPVVLGRTDESWKVLRKRETTDDLVRFWSAPS